MSIKKNYQKIREEIPSHVTIVLAAKTRNKEEILEAISAGATDIGQNYVQEAVKMHQELGESAKKLRWHMIGNLQKNKINKALPVFDVIQTVDSYELALDIDKRVEASGKNVVPLYLEINIGSELSKSGIDPDYDVVVELIKKISGLKHLRVEGLMTMGPALGDPEDSRQYFRKTKEIFDRIKVLGLPNVDLKTLSMGMSNSYKVAIEEGSNMVRLGTIVFGERE